MNDNDEMDYESSGGLIERIKESPRTVSALIIILIVAAAIYAFSGDDTNTPDTGEQAAVTINTEEVATTTTADEEDTLVSETDTVATDDTVADTQPTEVTQEELAETSMELPAATKDSQGYTEVAQAGDGRTHLARRAATRWLSENQAGFTVTNEHRIYIEDFVQKKLDTASLGLGDTRMISFDLIAEAVTAAGELTDAQLNNLTQYTSVLQ